MDPSPQQVFSERPYPEPRNVNQEYSCAACRDRRSIPGVQPVGPQCILQGCYVCADIERIKDEISRTYQHLSDLMKEQQQIMAKPRHDPMIEQMPVEILSQIFVFVKQAIFDYKPKEQPEHILPELPGGQPQRSPPLLVGAVCRKWRDITLSTPQLWTDIFINPRKYPEGQIDMVQTWARRSASLPLDIKLHTGDDIFAGIPDEFEDVLLVLRSLADRWNDITSHIPMEDFFRKLLHDLQEDCPINTLSLYYPNNPWGMEPIKLRHPLRPRYLKCMHMHIVPVDWSRLVFLDAKMACTNDVLHAIRDAQNLRHFIVDYPLKTNNFPIFTSFITNHSLIYLKTFGDAGDVIGHLILPSLQHLDYAISDSGHDLCFDSIVGFLDRSRPSLDNLIVRCRFSAEAPFPSFQKLPGITSLFIDRFRTPHHTPEINDFLLSLTMISSAKVIHPHLKELTLVEFDDDESRSTHRALPDPLVCFDSQTNTSSLKLEPTSENTASLERPLSRVNIRVSNRSWLKNNETTFLHLLALKTSGVEVVILNYHDIDMFAHIAELHGVVL